MFSCEVFNETDTPLIAGTEESIEVDIYDIFGVRIETLGLNNAVYRMSRYGESETIIEKNMPVNVTQEFSVITVKLNAKDTENLRGKFWHELILTDVKNKQFVVDLGKITIKPMIH